MLENAGNGYNSEAAAVVYFSPYLRTSRCR